MDMSLTAKGRRRTPAEKAKVHAASGLVMDIPIA
jgi:hypothetical protein